MTASLAEVTSPPEPTLTGATLTEQREIFLQGYRLYQEKKWEEARTHFRRALEVSPLLADYIFYYLGVLNRETGQTSEARAFFQRLVSEYPDSIWQDRALLEPPYLESKFQGLRILFKFLIFADS